MDQNQYAKGREAYSQCIQREGSEAVSWMSLGIQSFRINMYWDALNCFSWSIRSNPYLLETVV